MAALLAVSKWIGLEKPSVFLLTLLYFISIGRPGRSGRHGGDTHQPTVEISFLETILKAKYPNIH